MSMDWPTGDEPTKGQVFGLPASCLLPAFTVLAGNWLCGDLYPDTAARQLRVLTGFHDAFVICRRRSHLSADEMQAESGSRPVGSGS